MQRARCVVVCGMVVILVVCVWRCPQSVALLEEYEQYAPYQGGAQPAREQMLAEPSTSGAYRVFLRPNQASGAAPAPTQQLPMVSYMSPYPSAQTQVHVAAPAALPMPQTIRPVFNVIPNPGSADALRRVQNQMAAQRVAMAQMKENLGSVRASSPPHFIL